MSLRREVSDGDGAGRDSGAAERGNPQHRKSPDVKPTPSKKTGQLPRRIKHREPEAEEPESADRYIITYADLITLLLGLFIILYASSNVDVEKYKKVMQAAGGIFSAGANSGNGNNNTAMPLPAASGDAMVSLRGQITKIIEENNLNSSLQIVENERGFTIRILDDILFKSGSADLTDGSKGILSKLAVVLRSLTNDIRIEGHTDNVPVSGVQFPSNWHLSVARATNTGFYLMNAEKLPPGRVSVAGYAEYQPIATNETNEGRALNRRVDIVILHSMKK